MITLLETAQVRLWTTIADVGSARILRASQPRAFAVTFKFS